MHAPIDRPRLERLGRLIAEHKRREARKLQSAPGGLLEFVRYFWSVLEPETPLVEGWPLVAICQHLEAVTYGEIKRLLINVPPGFMKSMLTDVFWPAWEWGAMGMPHLRYLAFSYSAALTERDNGKLRDLLNSREYKHLWGHQFLLRKIGETLISNNKTGSKRATSVGGVGTGERGDRVICDDLHNVKEAESTTVRNETVRWFRESLSNRLNNMDQSAIVVIMQRVAEDDVSGVILSEDFDYVHLSIAMEYEEGRGCETEIGWQDPRTKDGELAWPARFSADRVARFKVELGPFAYAAQYRQSPEPRGGGILKRDYWQMWEDDNFPTFSYVLASADTAYTEKEENDPTGFTIWGVFVDQKSNYPKVMLIWAWRKHLELHGQTIDRLPGENDAAYHRRTSDDWGLVEWIAYSCKKFKVDRLLVEAKASGISAAQELKRLHGNEGWSIDLVTPEGDKVARAHAVEPSFAQGIIFAPDREWADLVIDETSAFPKGKYKDLTDSTTMALKYLREYGLISHAQEIETVLNDLRMHKPKQRPLYPV